jgi:hypothetical protein
MKLFGGVTTNQNEIHLLFKRSYLFLLLKLFFVQQISINYF